MAGYSTSNPPVKLTQGITGPALWIYTSAVDARAVVIAQDYFSNGLDLGMKVGDFVLSFETDALLGTLSTISTVDADGTLMVALVLS